MLPKKTFIYNFFRVLMVLMLLVGSSAIPAAAPAGAAAAPEHITLTWSDDPLTTQTITWKTTAPNAAGQVQYSEAAAKLFPYTAQTVAAEMQVLSTDQGEVSIHSATLKGLKPGTHYIYRVGDETSWSEIHSFATPAADVARFKFLVFGDSQSVNYDVWRTTLHQAFQANSDAAFLINAGDLVDVGQDYSQWTDWFQASQGVVDTIPVMPITGNHETYVRERGVFSLPVFFTAQFKLPNNGPEGLKGQVYSFDYGDVHFTMLDSQVGEEKAFIPNALDIQKAWLDSDLRATDKKWKVVFIHRPPYSNRVGRDNNHIRAAFVPIFDKYHADIVFTAHDHTYARTYPLHNDAVVDSPTQGTVYVATGRSGSKWYKDVAANAWDEFFHHPYDEPNYITVEVIGNSMSVKVFRQSGALLDAWDIQKEAQ